LGDYFWRKIDKKLEVLRRAGNRRADRKEVGNRKQRGKKQATGQQTETSR
jgi:hypothetical protein